MVQSLVLQVCCSEVQLCVGTADVQIFVGVQRGRKIKGTVKPQTMYKMYYELEF